MARYFAILTLSLLCAVGVIQALPTGAPSGACPTVTASPSTHGAPQPNPSPYTLTIDPPCGAFTSGQVYNVTLMAPVGGTFRGFLIAARQMGSTSTANLGTWNTMNNPDVQTTCDNDGGLTHTNNNNKTMISALWTAPDVGSGNIEFRWATVRVVDMHWANELGPVLADPTALAAGSSAAPTSVGTKLFLGVCATLILALSL